MEQTKYVSKDEFLGKKDISKPNYYAIITAEVRYSTKISDSAKLLFGEITALSNKYGYAFPTNNYLANLYGVSERTIRRRLEELKENDFITVLLIRDKNDNQVLQRRIYPVNKTTTVPEKAPTDINDHSPKDINDHSPKDINDRYNTTRIIGINNNNKAVVVSQNTIDEIKEKTQNRLVKENVENIIKQTGATEEELLTMVELMTNSTSTINNPIGWLVKAIKNGYEVAKSLKFKSNTNKNSFHDFQTSNTKYTNDELLAQLGLK
jgi:DNA-binding transcriptional regulator YhcF (GntR family)